MQIHCSECISPQSDGAAECLKMAKNENSMRIKENGIMFRKIDWQTMMDGINI